MPENEPRYKPGEIFALPPQLPSLLTTLAIQLAPLADRSLPSMDTCAAYLGLPKGEIYKGPVHYPALIVKRSRELAQAFLDADAQERFELLSAEDVPVAEEGETD